MWCRMNMNLSGKLLREIRKVLLVREWINYGSIFLVRMAELLNRGLSWRDVRWGWRIFFRRWFFWRILCWIWRMLGNILLSCNGILNTFEAGFCWGFFFGILFWFWTFDGRSILLLCLRCWILWVFYEILKLFFCLCFFGWNLCRKFLC